MSDINIPSPSPEELVSLGEKIYSDNREILERDHFNEYAVIEVESKNISINSDKLTAIQEAQEKNPGKLLYIVQIGRLRQQSNCEVNSMRKYGWAF